MTSDGFTYWPRCPECRNHLSCIQRIPENGVPAERYGFVCQGRKRHRSEFSHAEIVALQDERKRDQ